MEEEEEWSSCVVAATATPAAVPCCSSSSSSQRRSPKRFRGVRMRSWGKWVSEIREPKKRSRIWLGSYSTPEAAAHAYDMALYCLRGPLASLNFPGFLPPHDPPSMSPKSVQQAAIAAGLAADQLAARPRPDSTADSGSLRRSDSLESDHLPSPSGSDELRSQQRCRTLASINLNEIAPDT